MQCWTEPRGMACPLGRGGPTCQPTNLHRMKRYIYWLTLLFACLAVVETVTAAQKLELRKDDHVAHIGNALADRMQHDGWLETLIYAQFPQQDLVFRNLAVSGD